MSLRDDVMKLRRTIVDHELSVPVFARTYHIPVSALYRFINNKPVKLETLYRIDDAVRNHARKASKQRS